jgi:all-trans-retinol 13,14-reductase
MQDVAQYQVVIIGSGLGGLLCGVILAKYGYDVVIVEQNKQIGGCLQTFSFEKKIFDAAIHYLGGLAPGQNLYKIFDYVGIMQDLKIAHMDTNCFDQICFGTEENTYSLAQGITNFKAKLCEQFPAECSGIEQYVEFLEQTCAAVPLYNLRMGDEAEKAVYDNLSLQEVLGRCGLSEALQKVITGNAILYAGDKASSSWLVHALVAKSYIESSWRLEGGGSQIAKLLLRQLRHYGGKLYRNEKVIGLNTKDGLVHSAVTYSGRKFEGSYFIGAIHPQQVIGLLDNPNLLKKLYRTRIANAGDTVACVMLNIVLHAQTVPYRNYNINWSQDHPLNAIAEVSRVFPSNYSIYFTQDKQHPHYAESVSILAYVDNDTFKEWEQSFNTTNAASNRASDYQQSKEAIKEQLLSKVSERLPELKANVKAWKLATPLTYRDYQGTLIGSMYGIKKDVRFAANTRLSTKTRIENLYLTGQNISLHGVLGVSMASLMTVANFVDLQQLLSEINN